MANSSTPTDRKTILLANTVHEIRTPVQTIIGTLELLSNTPLNKEQTEYIRQIRFSTDVLLSLINDILDFSKIHSQEFKLEYIPFDIVTLTEQVVDLVSIEAFSKGLEIVTDVDYTFPPLVMGDPTRIQQVLLNIIKNAVKFTKDGYIHIELLRKNEAVMFFEVTDTGIGIPEEKRNKLFTDFYQADPSTTRKYGGTGLGLAICKELVTAMHGEIGVKSNPYGGSIFWFTLPLTAAPNPPQELKESVPVPAETRILLVDDNMLALRSLERKIAALGLTNIQKATNAQEALLSLEYAAKIGKPFKIAFTDMCMPRVDGWHLAADINENPLINDIKLYLIVPEGQMGSEAKMKLMNWFTGYLYKPVKREKLESLLKDTYNAPLDLEPAEIVSAPVFDDSSIANGLTILVAEDHPMNRKLLVTFLQKYGAEVVEAENGKETVDKILENPDISMIFMDIQMPILNGVDAAKQIRKNNYSGIIIACTANNDEGDFNQYRKIGMNDILVKPFKRVSVKAVIEKWKIVMELPGGKDIAILDSRLALNNTIWNLSDFEDTISGDHHLGCELLDAYRKQASVFIHDTGQAIKNNDFQKLRQLGHLLEGSSGAVSAVLLAHNAEELNKKAKEADIEGIQKVYTEFCDNFSVFELMSDKWKRNNE
jgi:CheY-like chemotaxis protein